MRTPQTPRSPRFPAAARRLLLIVIFTISGVIHFVAPDPFIRIVPAILPRPDLLVMISGAAELAGAIGLAIPATGSAAAWGLIALLVAVFPANIQMLWNAHQSGAPAWWQVALWLRLPLQAVLIWLAFGARRTSAD